LNIAIQNSSATQASLLVNLAPLCGYYLYVFLNTKPATNFDWNDSALFGMAMLVWFFLGIRFDTAFPCAGVLYSIYLLMSKMLSQMDVLSFMTISLFHVFFGLFVFTELSHFGGFRRRLVRFIYRRCGFGALRTRVSLRFVN
jgi:hypothetical protein